MKYCIVTIAFLYSLSGSAQDIKELYELGQYSKAIKSFNDIEKPSIDDQIILARAYAAKGMTLECMQAYQTALKSTKKEEHLKSKLQYAKILHTQGKLNKADSLYLHLLSVMPEHAEIFYRLGKIGAAREDTAYHQLYLTALLYDSTHIKAAHEASRYFMKIDNLKMAKMICTKTLKLVPNTPRLINLLAQIYYRENDYETSLKFINLLENLKTDLPQFIYEIKGNNYLKLNQKEKALTSFLKGFQKDNKDYSLCLKIAELYIFLENPENADKFLFLYQRLRDTSMWEFNYLKGKSYMQQNKHKMAFYQFKQTLDEKVDHEDSRYFRAVAADHFADDKSYVLDFYTNYIEFFEDEKDAKHIELALRREKEIRRELFMKE